MYSSASTLKLVLCTDWSKRGFDRSSNFTELVQVKVDEMIGNSCLLSGQGDQLCTYNLLATQPEPQEYFSGGYAHPPIVRANLPLRLVADTRDASEETVSLPMKRCATKNIDMTVVL